MRNTPRGVLTEIAKTFGCGFDDIEAWLEHEYGYQLPRLTDLDERLTLIRRTIGTAEACSVVEQARGLMKAA